jgi:molybdopterin-guanine dinucleotide biosynthesis protein A
VVVAGDAAGTARAADLLGRICEQVVVIAEPRASPLARVAAGLEAASSRRVLLVDASAVRLSPELVLALTASPQGPALISEKGPGDGLPRCAILERDPALAAARRRLRDGDRDLVRWLSDCGARALDESVLTALREQGGRDDGEPGGRKAGG